MNSLVRQFFSGNKDKSFKQVRYLSEEPEAKWEAVCKDAPDLPRGWFELSRISAQDRIDFTRDFWLDRMPYHPSAHPAFFEFFEQLDDIAIVLFSRSEEKPLDCELIYSLQDNSTFFRGETPL